MVLLCFTFLFLYTAGHTRYMDAVLYLHDALPFSSVNYLLLSSVWPLYHNLPLLMVLLYYKFRLHYTADHTRCMEAVLYKLQYHLSSSINYSPLSSVWRLYHNLPLLMVPLYYKFPPHYTAGHSARKNAVLGRLRDCC